MRDLQTQEGNGREEDLEMFIDVHINPAFYEPINGDEAREEMRH